MELDQGLAHLLSFNYGNDSVIRQMFFKFLNSFFLGQGSNGNTAIFILNRVIMVFLVTHANSPKSWILRICINPSLSGVKPDFQNADDFA